jgi:hypothetical protein
MDNSRKYMDNSSAIVDSLVDHQARYNRTRFTALISRQKTKHYLQKSIKYINFNIEIIESLNIVYS